MIKKKKGKEKTKLLYSISDVTVCYIIVYHIFLSLMHMHLWALYPNHIYVLCYYVMFIEFWIQFVSYLQNFVFLILNTIGSTSDWLLIQACCFHVNSYNKHKLRERERKYSSSSNFTTYFPVEVKSHFEHEKKNMFIIMHCNHCE